MNHILISIKTWTETQSEDKVEKKKKKNWKLRRQSARAQFVRNRSNVNGLRCNAKWIFEVDRKGAMRCNAAELIECPIRKELYRRINWEPTVWARYECVPCAALNPKSWKSFQFSFFSFHVRLFRIETTELENKKRITELIHKCHAMCNYWIVRFSQTSPAVVRALCDLCVRKTKMRHSDTCCTFVRSTDTRVVWMEASHHRPKQFRFLDFRVEMLFHSIILCFVLSIYTFFSSSLSSSFISFPNILCELRVSFVVFSSRFFLFDFVCLAHRFRSFTSFFFVVLSEIELSARVNDFFSWN